jgi:crossover junction endodeoxyribonuclease RusA
MGILMSKMIEIDLPWPVSENKYRRPIPSTRGGAQLVLTPEARQYKKIVGQVCMANRINNRRMDGPLRVVLYICPPDNRRRDGSNLSKAVWDALQDAGVFLDDSQIKDERYVMLAKSSPGSVRIRIWELTEEEQQMNQLDYQQQRE